jgi:hypothetical protein
MATTERTFLIQRYSTSNWPQVKGDAPFFATGPTFMNYAYGLEKFREWRFVSALDVQFQGAYGEFAEDEARYYAAWALLDFGIVQALWADHSRFPPEERWEPAVEQLAAEIPRGPIGESVIEYLSGLGGAGHFRSYVAEDQIELVPMPCPTS